MTTKFELPRKTIYLFALSLISFAVVVAISKLAHDIYFGQPFTAEAIRQLFVAIPGVLILTLISMVAGPFVGLLSSAPYFTLQFKLMLVALLIVAICSLLCGQKFKEKLWGRILIIVSFWMFFVAGGLGFGPQ